MNINVTNYTKNIHKGKGKVDPVLFLTEHHAMNMYWGVKVWLHIFLTSALDGGE
jgi:hypothetical protein